MTIILKEHWIGIIMMKEISPINHPIFFQGQTDDSAVSVPSVAV